MTLVRYVHAYLRLDLFPRASSFLHLHQGIHLSLSSRISLLTDCDAILPIDFLCYFWCAYHTCLYYFYFTVNLFGFKYRYAVNESDQFTGFGNFQLLYRILSHVSTQFLWHEAQCGVSCNQYHDRRFPKSFSGII